MGLFPHSFKFHMDSLYISWQLSRSRKKEEKEGKKRRRKRVSDKESMQREEESGEAQNGKHFLFFLFQFSPALFLLTPGLNPEVLRKHSPWFPRPFPGVVCNSAGSVTVESLCVYRLSPLLQAWDLPLACFLDSYAITNQHSQIERRGGGRRGEDMSSITIESCALLFFLHRYIDPIPQEHCQGEKEGHRNAVQMNELRRLEGII